MRFKGKKPVFGVNDTWDLTHVFSPIIREGLRKFVEVARSDIDNFKGVPAQFLDEFYPDHETSVDLPEGSYEAWVDFVEEMIEGFYGEFDSGPNSDDYEDYPKTESEYWKDFNNHRERQQKARENFGKYYDCLWW